MEAPDPSHSSGQLRESKYVPSMPQVVPRPWGMSVPLPLLDIIATSVPGGLQKPPSQSVSRCLPLN